MQCARTRTTHTHTHSHVLIMHISCHFYYAAMRLVRRTINIFKVIYYLVLILDCLFANYSIDSPKLIGSEILFGFCIDKSITSHSTMNIWSTAHKNTLTNAQHHLCDLYCQIHIIRPKIRSHTRKKNTEKKKKKT